VSATAPRGDVIQEVECPGCGEQIDFTRDDFVARNAIEGDLYAHECPDPECGYPVEWRALYDD
jgi:endogenous inhibitor of DNA gyrase (YacG/DUF329 family)